MATDAILTSFIVPIKEELDRRLPKVAAQVEIALSSAPLLYTIQSVGKNAPYVLAARRLGIDNCGHAFTSRFHHVEGFLVGICFLVCNIVMAVLSSLFVVFTFGKCPGITRACRRYWVHTAHAIAVFVSNLLGIFSPKAAFSINLSVVCCSGVSVLNTLRADPKFGVFQKEVLAKVKGKLTQELDDQIVLIKEKDGETASRLEVAKGRINASSHLPALAKEAYKALIDLRTLEKA